MRSQRAAITVGRPREEVQRLWEASPHRPEGVTASFADAPGDRGTEIHVELADGGSGVLDRVRGATPLAKAQDALRHFKQEVEAGEIARSDGVPEGERFERKAKQRPAQPLDDHELEKAGA